MDVSTATTEGSQDIAPFPVRRFSVAEYRRLGEMGVLSEDDSVELLAGWIVPKMNLNPAHSVSVQLASDALRKVLPDAWCMRIQDAVSTSDSEPEPDVAVVRGGIRDYVQRHPAPNDIGLVVEVSDTSVGRDRFKCRVYGKAGIAVYWIVNLVDRRIEMYTDPTGLDPNANYRRRQDFDSTAAVPFILADREIARINVHDVLP